MTLTFARPADDHSSQRAGTRLSASWTHTFHLSRISHPYRSYHALLASQAYPSANLSSTLPPRVLIPRRCGLGSILPFLSLLLPNSHAESPSASQWRPYHRRVPVEGRIFATVQGQLLVSMHPLPPSYLGRLNSLPQPMTAAL